MMKSAVFMFLKREAGGPTFFPFRIFRLNHWICFEG
jgi:hypothetical protein